MMIIKTLQNVYKICFSVVWMTCTCEVKIDLIKWDPHYVKFLFYEPPQCHFLTFLHVMTKWQFTSIFLWLTKCLHWMYPQHPLIPPLEDPTTCNNTVTHNSKRQDGSGFIGENGYIFHGSWCCIKVPLGGAYSKIYFMSLQHPPF